MCEKPLHRFPRALTVVSISAELFPFSKSGGLGEVARMIPKAVAQRGHRVCCITPLHRAIDPASHQMTLVARDISVRMGRVIEHIDLWEGKLDGSSDGGEGIPVYCISHPEMFAKPETLYLTGYDNERFFLFGHAVFAALEYLNISPHVLHAHDWHAGLVPALLKKQYAKKELFTHTVSVYTIHNLAFQMERNWWEVPPEEKDGGTSRLPDFGDKEALRRINFTLRAILTADAVTTVSDHYAHEILSPEFSEGLSEIFRRRKAKVTGILHGIDYETYNPSTDPGLAVAYDAVAWERKRDNKHALQKLFGLPQNDVAVIGMVSRLTEQKGFELILRILDRLLELPVQIAVMGKGDTRYERVLERASRRHDRFSLIPFDQKYETLVYAGSDMYLMPSRFEPCGLPQLISLRYGSIPVVHEVGGLAETITDYDAETAEGNGFVFSSYNTYQLYGAVVRALETYRRPNAWGSLVQRAMSETYSWDLPARRYEQLYRNVLKEKFSSK